MNILKNIFLFNFLFPYYPIPIQTLYRAPTPGVEPGLRPRQGRVIAVGPRRLRI